MEAFMETREKDRQKDISSFIETLLDSLMVDERSKHRLPFLHPVHPFSPCGGRISELNWLFSTLNLNDQKTPNSLDYRTYLFSSTNDDKKTSLTFSYMSSYLKSADIAFHLFTF